MKKHIPSEASLLFLFLALALFPALALHSQSPQGIPYQAMIRGNDGSPLLNTPVSVRFTLHQNAMNGAVEYQETQSLTTNDFGLINTVFGNGIVVQGTFSGIVWSNTTKFIQIEADYGSGYIEMGTQQLMSVPYALHSSSSSYAVNAQSASNGFSSVSLTGDTLYLANGNFIIVPGISAANSNNGGGGNNTTCGLGSIVLPGNTTCANEFISVAGCNGQTSLTYDGRTYDLVEIGGQCWFADNLATDQYRNGDPIPTGLDNTTWQNTTSGAYAVYNNDPANDVTYGKLYNWYTTADSRGLCPTGWHVPTDCESMFLEGSLGMSVEEQIITGNRGDVGGQLKTTDNWLSPNLGATNSSGFTMLPSGFKRPDGSYSDLGGFGFWWSSSESSDVDAWYRRIGYHISSAGRYYDGKRIGFSIRCLKDSESASIQGCTDGEACNFLASANQDDGSCLYQNATCDDGNANTTNDVINGECVCAGTQISGSGTGAQVLPGNTTCADEFISVTGCNGQTSLTYDGRTYDLVEIGGQCWFADNLATDQYRNGDAIPTGLDNAAWGSTTSGAFAIYNNDPANDVTYGKLYNWYTTADSRGLCPTGWHVPTDCEWMFLEGSLGMTVTLQETTNFRGNDEGGKLKSTSYWYSPNAGATNITGFTALPGGSRNGYGGYDSITGYGHWWTTTIINSESAWTRVLANYSSTIARNFGSMIMRNGYSIRCLKD